MENVHEKITELKKLIDDYSNEVKNLQAKVVNIKDKQYTHDQLVDWLNGEKKLDELKTQLEEITKVASEFKSIVNAVSEGGGKRKTRRNRKSKKSKTKKRKGKK